MQVLSGIEETRAGVRQLRGRVGQRGTVGLVPTMGALHEGHRSLLRAARQSCKAVVASIFVNPTQFGPNEDFHRYPRPLEDDFRMMEAEGVDMIFTPSVEAMFPPGASTFVEVGGLSERLDGASRPGHFRGVATVVAKLFQIVQPDRAFFGQKDAAQLAVLRRMVRDLNFPVELVACPIVRELDGLAMSSRNGGLSPDEWQQALVLFRALTVGLQVAKAGEHRAAQILEAMTDVLQQEPSVRVDYVAVVDADTLLPLDEVGPGALLAVAAYVGDARLIDNVVL